MIKQFFKDSFIYSISGILSRGISLILLPFYTRAFSSADYGLIDYITAISGIVAVTVALEITQGMARYYAEASLPDEKSAYASNALSFALISYFLFFILVVIFVKPITENLLGNDVSVWITIIAALTYVFQGLVYTIQNQLRWDLKAKLNAKLSVYITLISIGLTLLLVLGFKLGVQGALIAQLLASFIISIVGFYAIRSTISFSLSGPYLKRMLLFSLPLVPSSVGVVAALYVDRLVVKDLLTMSDLGVFGVGYRIASVIILVMMGFQNALTPLIYAQHKEPGTPEAIARIFRTFVAMSLLLFAILSLFSPEVIAVLTPEAYHQASIIVPPMVFAVLLWQMYIFAPGLSLAKKTTIIGILNMASALINLGLNYLLIPLMGIFGAALATFVSAALVFSIYMFYSQQLFPVPHRWKNIFASVIFSVGLVYLVLLTIHAELFTLILIKVLALAMVLFLLIQLKLVLLSDLDKVKQIAQKYLPWN